MSLITNCSAAMAGMANEEGWLWLTVRLSHLGSHLIFMWDLPNSPLTIITALRELAADGNSLCREQERRNMHTLEVRMNSSPV